MKHSLIVLFSLLSFTFCFASCDTDGPIELPDTDVLGQTDTPGDDDNDDNNDNPMSNTMKIKIGSSTFTATLFDNVTATAFKALLPMTVNMNEMNGNEKYYNLPGNLPTAASSSGTIQNGDLMLWGSNTVVLFYKTFSTSYSYSRLGRINDVSGLNAAVGSGNVTVTFELQ